MTFDPQTLQRVGDLFDRLSSAMEKTHLDPNLVSSAISDFAKGYGAKLVVEASDKILGTVLFYLLMFFIMRELFNFLKTIKR